MLEDHVPLWGFFVWKYRGEKSLSSAFRLLTSSFWIAVAFLFIGGIALFVTLVPQSANSGWVFSCLIGGAILFFLGLCFEVVLIQISMQYVFVRNEKGTLFFFDLSSPLFLDYMQTYFDISGNNVYESESFTLTEGLFKSEKQTRLIKHVEQEQVIENAVRSGNPLACGYEIVGIRRTKIGGFFCRTDVILRGSERRDFSRPLLLSKHYAHVNILMEMLACLPQQEEKNKCGRIN